MRTAIERNDTRLVHHLIANRDKAWPLRDVVAVAVDRRHHRAGQAPCDAADVERQILWAIERTGVVAIATAACGTDGRRALLRLVRGRRDLSVFGIGDHPRAAVRRVVVLVPMRGASAGVVLR